MGKLAHTLNNEYRGVPLHLVSMVQRTRYLFSGAYHVRFH